MRKENIYTCHPTNSFDIHHIIITYFNVHIVTSNTTTPGFLSANMDFQHKQLPATNDCDNYCEIRNDVARESLYQ